MWPTPVVKEKVDREHLVRLIGAFDLFAQGEPRPHIGVRDRSDAATLVLDLACIAIGATGGGDDGRIDKCSGLGRHRL